jgi:hypothetical protein
VYIIVAAVVGTIAFILLVAVIALLLARKKTYKEVITLERNTSVKGEDALVPVPVTITNPLLSQKQSSFSNVMTNSSSLRDLTSQQSRVPNPLRKAAPLPAGWEELVTDEGEVYYGSMYSDETTWDRPTAPAKKPAPLPAGWEELVTDEGEVYYGSMYSDETTWDRPTAPATKVHKPRRF